MTLCFLSRWTTAVVAMLATTVGFAQDLRCYTVTKDIGRGTDRAPVVAQNLTLFHATKVYDYIDSDSLREVIVYDAALKQFVVLQLSSGMAAKVSQDQVRHFLNLARQGVEQDLAQPQPSTPKASIELLQFQLQPKFDTQVNDARLLRLTSPRYRYEVSLVSAPEPAVAQAYLRYADAIAELNAVLHPSLLPGPRLQLNQELRSRGLLPHKVRRTIEVDRVIDLQAEHQWTFRLDDVDRQYIAMWEAELSKSSLRWMEFKQLQQQVLGGKMAQR